MAESQKPFTYDGYSPLVWSPDGYLLPSPGERKDEAERAKAAAEQRAIEHEPVVVRRDHEIER